MALSDLWLNSKEQLEDKHIQQIIAFAGNGQLRDGNATTIEFRSFLDQIPSEILKRYTDECLKDSFKDSGFVLQDIINQVGKRLGFDVISGRYRGTAGRIGFDGLWKFPDGHSVIVEVKTTDAYRIDLSTVVGYRKALIAKDEVEEDSLSILIVVGRKDTGDLEAQIRGSRYAWDMRLISADALLRLMELKEEVEDPTTVQRIHDILIPREFTKLDEIVDILFSTAEEVKQEEIVNVEEDTDHDRKPKFIPVSFHESCVTKVQSHLKKTLLKRSRAKFTSPDNTTALVCAVSKEHVRSDQKFYWFAFHPHQKEFLDKSEENYIAFGCGSKENVLLIPFSEFTEWLEGLNITEREDKFYWHVHIFQEENEFVLHRKKGFEKISLTKHLLPTESI